MYEILLRSVENPVLLRENSTLFSIIIYPYCRRCKHNIEYAWLHMLHTEQPGERKGSPCSKLLKLLTSSTHRCALHPSLSLVMKTYSAIADGAVWAMEPLYQRYSLLLSSFAYSMVTDHQVAQNLTQETFLAVWRQASAFASQAGAVRSPLLSFFEPPHHRLAACSSSSLQLAGGHVGAGR